MPRAHHQQNLTRQQQMRRDLKNFIVPAERSGIEIDGVPLEDLMPSFTSYRPRSGNQPRRGTNKPPRGSR